MSTRMLKIIPADQEYVPSPEQQANAVAVFREMVRYGEIEATVYEDLFEHCNKFGFEGVVSKRRNTGYASGSSRHWVKTKCPDWKR